MRKAIYVPQEASSTLFFPLLWACVAHLIALRRGFFIKLEEKPPSLRASYLLIGFSLFLLASISIVKPSTNEGAGWGHLFTILTAACLLSLLLWKSGLKLFGSTFWRPIKLGAFTWFLAYPTVLFVNQLIELTLLHFTGRKGEMQVAVETLKKLFHYPLLFTLLSIAIVTLVPFIEEFLFRGLLQGWLRGKMKRGYAIVLTSLLFSLAHFSIKQGIGNVEVLPSLFLLSLYLGYLYERERSLWAPIALHGTFNLMSIVGIVFAG